jgi:hypothetical protein
VFDGYGLFSWGSLSDERTEGLQNNFWDAKHYGVFAQNKNCGAKETAVAR